MFEWLKQRIISWLLSRYVGKWIQVERKNLHGTTEGKVWTLEAENLLLRTDCLENMDIPFSVRFGTVKKLSVRWEDKQSLKIHVDTIFACLESRKDKIISSEMQRAMGHHAKLAELELWESRLDAGLAVPSIHDKDDQKDKGDDARGYRAVLDKLEVTISNIHFCYYDANTMHTFGAHIDTITLNNKGSDENEQTNKSADVAGLAAYIDASDAPLDPEDARQRQHAYVLHPLSAHVTLSYDSPKAKLDLKRAKIVVVASVPALAVDLRRQQYLCIMSFVDFWTSRKRRNVIRLGRPELPIKGHAQAWWTFVLYSIKSDVRDRIRRRSLAFQADRRKKRLQYVDLYLRRRIDDLNRKEQRQIDALEEEFNFQDIVFFRCTALRKMQASSQAVVQRKKKTWGQWLGGGKPPKAIEEDDTSEHGPTPFHNLTKEERDSLLSAVGGDGSSATFSSLTQSDHKAQVLYSVTASLESCKARLIDVSGKLDATLSFTNATLGMRGGSHAFEVESGLQSLLMNNTVDDCTILKQTKAEEAHGEDLMRFVVKKDVGCTPSHTFVKVRVASIDVVINPHVIIAIARFWDLEDSSVDLAVAAKYAQDTYSEMRGDARKITPGQQKGECVELDIDVGAPSLFIYENTRADRVNVLLLRLGHFTLKHLPVEQEEENEAVHKNKFALGVEQMGIDLLQNVDTRVSTPNSGKRICVVEDTCVDSHLDVSLPLTTPGQVAFLSADMPVLNVSVTAKTLCSVVKILTSWDQGRMLFASFSKSPQVTGRVLVKGLKGREEEWCWRWLSLQNSNIVLRKIEDPSSPPDQIMSMDKYFVMKSLEHDSSVISLRELKNDQLSASEILIFAGREHDRWLRALRDEQAIINPFLDYDTLKLPSPESILESLNDGPKTHSGRLDSLLFRLSLNVQAVRIVLKQKDNIELLEIRVGEVKAQYELKDGHRALLLVRTMEISDIQRQRVNQQAYVLQQKAVPSPSGHEEPCLSFRITAHRGEVPKAHLHMAAINLCLDPVLVQLVTSVQIQVSQAWQTIEALAGGDDTLFSPRNTDFLSPRSETSIGSGARKARPVLLLHLVREDVPSAFLSRGGSQKIVKKVFEFEADGLTVHLLNKGHEDFCQASMRSVQLTQEDLSMGILVKGTLGSLLIKDTSAPESVHPDILSTSDETSSDALVRFDIATFDPSTLSSTGVGSSVKIAINHPQIKVMFRFLFELGKVLSSFNYDKSTARTALVQQKVIAIGTPQRSPRTSDVGFSPVLAKPESRTRVEIDLLHPVVSFPRSSRTVEAWTMDLGRIRITNYSTDDQDDDDGSPAPSWIMSVHNMKVETLSNSNQCRSVTQDVNFGAKIVRQSKVGEPNFYLNVHFEDVKGCLTDAQYALVMGIVAENLTEKRVLSSDLVEGSDDTEEQSRRRDITLDKLLLILSRSVLNSSKALPLVRYDISVGAIHVNLVLAKDLDTKNDDTITLVMVSSAALHVRYEILDIEQEHGTEALFWRCTLDIPDLKITDNRPQMAARALSLLSTKGGWGADSSMADTNDSFTITFSKTRDLHLGLHLEVKRAEAVADAGLLFTLLDWIGRGPAAAQKTQPVVGQFRYLVTSPGGFLCSVVLPEARIHFVSSFEDAEADAFILEGAIEIGYAHAFGQLSFSFEALDMGLLSHRSTSDGSDRPVGNESLYEEDRFADPEWEDCRVLGPSTVKFSYRWFLGTFYEGRPGEMHVSLSDSDARFSHEEVLMLRTVNHTLMKSLKERPNRVEAPAKVIADVADGIMLNFGLEISRITVMLGAYGETGSLFHVRLMDVVCTGSKSSSGRADVQGTLGAMAIIDESVGESLQREILTVSQALEDLVEFKYTTFDNASARLSGVGSSVKIVINSPQITVLMRCINELTSFLGSFDERVVIAMRTGSVFNSTFRSPSSPKVSEPLGPLTNFDIDLIHPVVNFPRSSHSTEMYSADLGRIHVKNSRSLGDAAQWDISIHDMKLETVSSTNQRIAMVQKVSGTAKIIVPRAIPYDFNHEGAEPRFSVLIDLEGVHGRMSDAQYALLMCIFAENFTELRIKASHHVNFFVESMTPNKLQDHGDVLESLARCIEQCQKNSTKTNLAAKYDIRVNGIDLSVGNAPGLDSESMTPLAQAVSSSLHVTYETMDPMAHDIGLGSDVLLWRCEASFADIEINDKRPGVVAKAKSFLATCTSPEPLFEDAALEKGQPSPRPAIQESPDYFVLSFVKTVDCHTGLDIALKKVEGVADVGLFLSILEWIGKGSKATSNISPLVGKLRYRLVSPGGFLLTTNAPKARIHFVSNFNSFSPDGFITQSNVDCMYAHHEGQLTLRVDLKDFCLTSHAASRPASNANMQIVRPCLVSYTQKWFFPPAGLTGPGAQKNNNLEMYAQAADFNAMVTYEDVLLGMEVFTTLMDSMHLGKREPEPQVAPYQKEYPPASKSQSNGGKLGLFGMNLTIIFVDDYGGRWIPLLRLCIPNVWIQGTTGSTVLFNTKVRLNLDYFHNSTSTWRSALEPWDIQVQYMSAEGADGTHSELHFHSPDDISMVHISSAVIDSLTRANNTWTQDRRTFALMKHFDDTENNLPLTPSSDEQKLMPQTPGSVAPSHWHHTSFVPYTVHNFLAEDLICILEDGTEYTINPLCALELTYEQVWRRRGALQIIARDSNLNSIENSVCLQIGGTEHVFCKVSVEIEQTTSYILRQGDPTGVGPSCPLSLVCDLSQREGLKILSVSSMVTIKNCSGIPLATAILASDDVTLIELGIVRAGGAMALPLQYTREGTVCFRAAVEGMQYEWCNAQEDGIDLRAVHDGTVQLTQKVDGKFQKLFGDHLPLDTRLVGWYTCANEVDGVLRQGVMYVTSNAVCHYSNIMGGERREVIALNSIRSIAKCTTAFVFPNAISLATDAKTYYFRTLLNRGEAFRAILNLLPKDIAVKADDDIDEKGRRLFNLDPSDVIISVHTCSWHHEPKITDGHVLLTRKNVCFMGNAESPVLIKIPWKEVRNVERKKSFIVRNNALLIVSREKDLFLSSAKWNRDKVIDEEIGPLWKVESGDGASRDFQVDDAGKEQKRIEEVDQRCRTVTCRLQDHLQTKTKHDPKDQNALYVRQKARAKDSCRWTVIVLDAITRKRGPDRVAGNPCVIELHPPWMVENLSATAVEFQLIDQRQSVVSGGSCGQGELAEILAIGLRREVHLRLRMADAPPGKVNAWSTPLLLNTSGSKPEFDELVELTDAEGIPQPVQIEVRRHFDTCGFRIRLYNRCWLYNLTGMRLQFRSAVALGELSQPRVMPLGIPFGFNFDQDTLDLSVKLDGFDWSNTFSIGQQEEQTSDSTLDVRESWLKVWLYSSTCNPGDSADLAFDFSFDSPCSRFYAKSLPRILAGATFQSTLSVNLRGSQASKNLPGALPNQQVTIDVSQSTATGRFDRTTIIYFSPQIILENLLSEPVVIWQRATQATDLGSKRPTVWLEPGRVMPFYPEGDRRACRLSVNVASGDIAKECAAFAPVKKSHEPVLLSCSNGHVILTDTQPLEHGGACLVRFHEPTGVLPHKLRNHTSFFVGLKQLGSSQNKLLSVRPGEIINMVWPDPLLPKILVLAQIDGKPVPLSNHIDLDNLENPVTGLYPQSQAMLVQKILAVSVSSSDQPRYALRLTLPADTDIFPLPPQLIELTSTVVLGRDPGACACKVVPLDCGAASDIISRQHVQIEPAESDGWTLVDLGSTNGVIVNGYRVLRHKLQHGDVVMLGGAHGVGVGEQPVNALSPFVYVFETRVGGRDDQEREDASLMQATMILENGTKVMHVTVGALPGGHGAEGKGKGDSSVLTLRSRGISILLEDDTKSLEADPINKMLQFTAKGSRESLVKNRFSDFTLEPDERITYQTQSHGTKDIDNYRAGT